ncbi:T9SS C-terminal target domain-containing protein [candidate division KSB1 bacterium]|nr:MAG: T9SS C-terminal target domain-containing protein [candidate division KSB1 bacterium]
MRQLWTLMLLAIVCICTAASGATPVQPQSLDQSAQPETRFAVPQRANSHLDETLLSENWESGTLNGWEVVDLTAVPGQWHLDDYQAFGGTGTSWWVGNPEINTNGGYDNEWYMVLDMPSLTLPAGTPMMRFWHRYKVEDPSSADPPYNGWDGMNLRISTNGGTNWMVIPSTALTPVYDRTSLYGFGVQHCEGPNIPGWCGTNTTWHQQTVNLTTWAGQTVIIRFAFGSDPGFCTSDDATMFGWMIDNVRCYAGTDTFFTDNADSVGLWRSGVGRNPAGSFWRVDTDTDPENGTYVLMCNQVSTGDYVPNMNCAIMSPYIDLRTIAFGTVKVDVRIKGDVPCDDPDNHPEDCDAWGAEITVDSGRTWCALNNPTCNPDCTSYRYIGPVPSWEFFSESGFSSEWKDLYQFVGHVVRIRFYEQSTCDLNVAEGMMFDDFSVVFTPGFPNDVSCATIQVRYPNVAGRPMRIRGFFENPGANAQNDVTCYYRVMEVGTWRAFFPPIASIAHGTRATRDTVVTIATPGVYTFQTRSGLIGDQNLANDTATCWGVQVQPADSPLELGYDNHTLPDTFYYFPSYETGSGPLVHFTPLADGVVPSRFHIQNVRIQFSNSQDADNMPFELHVYESGQAAPGLEIVNTTVNVNRNETGVDRWKSIDISTDPDTRDVTHDFWVWLKTTNSGPTPRYPAVVGRDELPWNEVHYYSWTGSGTPSTQPYFFQIHATIVDATSAAGETSVELPASWGLMQNYPNPFNPATDIRHDVPRADHVTLKVFNLMGQEVATLVNGMVQAGSHTVSFSGANLSSGVYLYKLESGSFSATRKMLLMK